MKRRILAIISIIACIVLLTGCKSFVSYTYKVDTGDKIEIKLDTSDGHKINKEVPFKISKDKAVLTQGTFTTLNGYDEYLNEIKVEKEYKVIKEEKNKNMEYIFYSHNDTEYNYIIKVKGSKTCVILANNVSEKSAKEVFDLLTIRKAKK